MPKKFWSAAIALSLIVSSASACRKGAEAAAQNAEAAKPQPPKPVPQQLPDVIARVNGEAVTKVKELEPALRQGLERVTRENRPYLLDVSVAPEGVGADATWDQDWQL